MPLFHTAIKSAALAAALGLSATAALAQQGAAPYPTNPNNQVPAPGNTQPTDPAAASNPAARVPTAPEDRKGTGAATGTGAGAATGPGPGNPGPATKNDSPDNTPLSPSNSGGPRPGGGTGGGPSR